MMNTLLVGLLVLASTVYAQQGCIVNVKNKQLMAYPQPLLLLPGGSLNIHGFVKPTKSGRIELSRGDRIIIACPGSTIKATNVPVSTATCFSGTTFTVNGQPKQYADFKCRKRPIPVAKRTNLNCGSNNQYHYVQVGFEVDSSFYSLINSCFDQANHRTVFAHSLIIKEIEGRQKTYPNSPWETGGLFGNINMGLQYEIETEKTTVGKLLGSPQLGARYIDHSQTSYLAKGHLVAKTDFALGALQHATFMYVNCAPQWQRFNCGNWKTMEGRVRKYAHRKSVDLDTYTGTYEITTLPNVNNIPTDLYLYFENQRKYIPVPGIFWKIVYDEQNTAAVVFVGVNNPYNPRPPDICTDVCSSITWLSWSATDSNKGFAYCCTYSDFKAAVPDAPTLNVTRLLT